MNRDLLYKYVELSRNLPDQHELSQGQGCSWPEVGVWVSILIGADSDQQWTNAA